MYCIFILISNVHLHLSTVHYICHPSLLFTYVLIIAGDSISDFFYWVIGKFIFIYWTSCKEHIPFNSRNHIKNIVLLVILKIIILWLLFQTYLWVLNDEEEFKKAFELGATGVMTDYPSRLKRFLTENPQYQWWHYKTVMVECNSAITDFIRFCWIYTTFNMFFPS